MDLEEVMSSRGNTVIAAVIALLFIGAYVLYRQSLPKPLPTIPFNAASAASVLGDGLDMARTVAATGEFGPWCAAQIEKVGAPICQVFVQPFAKPWVLVADYRESYDILARRTAPSRDADFDKSSFITGNMSCLGEFHAAFMATKTGDAFRSHRALIQDLMTPSFLHGVMAPVVYGKALELVALLEAKMRLSGGRPFSARADLDCLAMDVMLYFAFGEYYNKTSLGPQTEIIANLTTADMPGGQIDEPVPFPEAPAGDFVDAVRAAPGVVEACINSLFPRLSLWWWQKQSWYKKIFSQRDHVLSEQFAKALEAYRGGKIHSGAEHMLMRAEREAEKQGRNLDLEAVALGDELFGNMIAGNHTTGGMLGWIVKALTIYSGHQAKLRATLYAALPDAYAEDRAPTVEELRRARLPYLDAFIEETMRLNPVPVTRETIRDTTILGHPVPKGCQVFLVSNGPGFLSPSPSPTPVALSDYSTKARVVKTNDHWDEERDLRTFDPERWLVRINGGDDGTFEFNGAAGPQLVFGHGIRGCWGKRLAQMELRTVTALLVWHFELLGIPEVLAGNGATEGVARRPRQVIVRLKKVVR
ncbi:cytochrome P450 [Xylariaceae sp. FL1651]|nr:cytochrome P450 [Xylariaceae sp. FL1651]